MVNCATVTYPEEAIGIVRAAKIAGLHCVIGITIETDGKVPNGMGLGEAIDMIDSECRPEYYMVNCAHPTHLTPTMRQAKERNYDMFSIH